MTASLVLVLRIGLAVVLYYFLWRVFQTLRQDLIQQGGHLSNRKKTSIGIHAKTSDETESTYNLAQTEIVIGRGSQCDITIKKDEALSARHARISFHHAQWWLEDLKSRNGTFLNKDRITTPTVVINGDQFTCGNTTLTLSIDNLDTQLPKQHTDESGGDE